MFLLVRILLSLDVGIMGTRFQIVALLLAAQTSGLEFLQLLSLLILLSILISIIFFLILFCVMFGYFATESILARLTTAPPHFTTVIRL